MSFSPDTAHVDGLTVPGQDVQNRAEGACIFRF